MTDATSPPGLTAFLGCTRIAQGPRERVLADLRRRNDNPPALVFDDASGERVELDLWSTAPAPAADGGARPARGVGRPRLGVVAREVTLLPRHWDWLSRQPGGASVALRRLVEDARRVYADRDAARAAREAAYGFMSSVASALPGFEEASRALFAGDPERFAAHLSGWPADVADYARHLARGAWAAVPERAS
ncbi:DUF2239 family protein [uncultured Pseudacidovorax sp.]|uniref:DUF2239 family protein n=1 Tax=uncultured Pseudacidovorax sp. TaxID=679313 RepID=UPI0025D088EB|nr:DUF2239 family protein [uncultured Pseudacidovorax sp.]